MTLAYRNEELLGMVDKEAGTVDRRIYSEQDIYELELERIFARAWNFMAHDSQIPNPGDFFQTVIGEDRVICVRDNDGMPQVLVNTCRHRGNAICRADEGHATSFMCTYHGWTYDLKGALVGVPGFKEVYHEELDRENWGLIKAGQVDTFSGFIFATLDAEAPPLYEYLGEVARIGLNLLAARGDIAMVGGVGKYVIPCNWKLAADNSWDFYHPYFSHASAFMSGIGQAQPAAAGKEEPPPPSAPSGSTTRLLQIQIVALGEYGHALSGPVLTEEMANRGTYTGGGHAWRKTERAKEMLTQVGLDSFGYSNVFPNCWVAQINGQICLRMPKGPSKTEMWWFTFVDKAMSQEVRQKHINGVMHTFGPAGMLEQEDGENWEQSTIGTRGIVSREYPLNYSLNRGKGEIIDDETGPAHIKTHVNEHAQLWYYRGWADWMAAESWPELLANHSPSPQGYV